MHLHPQFWWWVTRSTGIVAWASATATVAWGIAVSGKLVRRRRLPAWMLDLHRYLGTLTLAFVAVHLISLVADSYTDFGLRDLFVPMASTWKPGAVAWGIGAMYALVVVQVTSWLMHRIPRKIWHGIHFLSYGVFVAATVHAITSGTDWNQPALQIGVVAGCTLVITLTVLRVASGNSGDRHDPDGRAAQIAAAREAILNR
ncbi:MAG: ferric reductase-like transmembrane domain-containing protein [Actinomycetes bacterium]